MRKRAIIINAFIALILGALLGIGSAIIGIEGVINSSSIKNGPWMTNCAIGSERASPYLRAAVAIHGLLALRQSEAMYYIAYEDSEGNPLDGNSTYRIRGKSLDARWWSITAYGADEYLIPNKLHRYSYNMDNVPYDSEGTYTIYVSREEKPDAWLPLGNQKKFSLTIRLYNPGLSARHKPGQIDLPKIDKERKNDQEIY